MRSRNPSLLVAVLALAVLSLATVVRAQDEASRNTGFLRAEYEVLGRTASPVLDEIRQPWRQIGGEDMGGGAAEEEKDEESTGPSNTGDKVKAGVFSAVLPGAGQLYNGDKKKGFIMMGIEVAIWGAYFAFDHQGDNRMESARDWAGLYAGTSGSHPESYWQSVGRYMDSDAYNESLLREARALGEGPPTLVSGADTWQWANNDRRQGYGTLRSEGNSAYDRRDFMILFAVVNRAVSVVDAVIGAGNRPGAIETEVLGMDMGLEMLPSWRDPGARWVVSRSF